MSWSDLFTYWQAKHVGGIPPARADLDPIAEIPKLVRNLILIDCLADGYRYRLIGSELVSRMGRDVTGKDPQHGRYNPGLVERWIAALDLVSKTREPQLLRSHLEGGGTALTLMLPLVSREGSTEMLLGGSFSESPTEGFWQPNQLERVDMAALPANTADGSYPSRRNEENVRARWATKYFA